MEWLLGEDYLIADGPAVIVGSMRADRAVIGCFGAQSAPPPPSSLPYPTGAALSGMTFYFGDTSSGRINPILMA
jgi:hypothetical protein